MTQQNIDKGEVCDYKCLHLKMINKSTLILQFKELEKEKNKPKASKRRK